ncbi:MAG: V4R domain-containing protein [Gemmatimonadota bacterium]|nr:V4R domain-containing protein [Gemmatimonadota bacterium]
MKIGNGEVPEIAVPVTVFRVLRRELEKEVGTLPAVRALHHAGYETGTAAASDLVGHGGRELSDLPSSEFWDRVERSFQRRGWGTLGHEDAHPGVGILRTKDWVEARGDEPDPEGSCSFSTGYLAGLLSELSGRPVAVLEVSCRSRGDDACRFAFGSETVIHELYGRMLDGADLSRALTEL